LTRLRIFPEFFDFQQKLEMMPKIEKKTSAKKAGLLAEIWKNLKKSPILSQSTNPKSTLRADDKLRWRTTFLS